MPVWLPTWVYNFAQWMDKTPFGRYMRESLYSFPIVETLHIFGIVFLLTSAFLLDMRLFGIGPMRDEPVPKLAKWILPWVWTGFAIQVTTGLLMFSAEATRSALNSLFWVKMLLIIVAGLNALVFHSTMYKNVETWKNDRVAPLGARVYGVISISSWFLVVGLGRWFSFHLT